MKYTVEQQRENAKRWIKALRSGEYRQTTSFLRTNNSFCCLGVACNIFKKELSLEEVLYSRRNPDSYVSLNEIVPEGPSSYIVYAIISENTVKTKSLPEEVRLYLGLYDSIGMSINNKVFLPLAALNDKGYTFNDIADHLEAHWDQYFTHKKDSDYEVHS